MHSVLRCPANATALRVTRVDAQGRTNEEDVVAFDATPSDRPPARRLSACVQPLYGAAAGLDAFLDHYEGLGADRVVLFDGARAHGRASERASVDYLPWNASTVLGLTADHHVTAGHHVAAAFCLFAYADDDKMLFEMDLDEVVRCEAWGEGPGDLVATVAEETRQPCACLKRWLYDGTERVARQLNRKCTSAPC